MLVAACFIDGAGGRAVDEPGLPRPASGKLPGQAADALYRSLRAEIDQLPALFEQAFPQWVPYFNVKERDHGRLAPMTGFLMKDKTPAFAEAGRAACRTAAL